MKKVFIQIYLSSTIPPFLTNHKKAKTNIKYTYCPLKIKYFQVRFK